MLEIIKTRLERLPESVRNGGLVFIILLLAFGASCGGTFAIFAGSFMRKTDLLMVSFGWAFLVLGPIGFFWFFFKKLGMAEGFKWIAEMAGILVAYGLTWMVTVGIIDKMTMRDYSVNNAVSFEDSYPAFTAVVIGALFLVEFALFCYAMSLAGKRYAERRERYLKKA